LVCILCNEIIRVEIIRVRFQLKSWNGTITPLNPPRLPAPHHPAGEQPSGYFCLSGRYQTLLNLLLENALKFKVAIHAYVLMTNHFHLLATPETADGLPQMMQAVGRRYVRWFNDAQGRSGTLWEGRYKSTVIDTDQSLLTCMA
jgi:putative transposase